MSIRVFIADDHGILRGGLRALITLQPDMEVVGEAANGPDAEIGVKDTEPDVVLMDVTCPTAAGFRHCRREAGAPEDAHHRPHGPR